MQTRNEVGILLFFDYLLKLKREPGTISVTTWGKVYFSKCSLSCNFRLVRVDDIFDDDHQGGLEKCRVCDRVQDRRAGLE